MVDDAQELLKFWIEEIPTRNVVDNVWLTVVGVEWYVSIYVSDTIILCSIFFEMIFIALCVFLCVQAGWTAVRKKVAKQGQ